MKLRPLLALIIASSAVGQEAGHQARDVLFQQEVDKMFPALVETRRDLHAHPELSNQEERTAKLVADRLRKLGLEVRTGVGKHGVVAVLNGTKEGRCVAFRADMDALPIQELNDVPYRSQNPGVMHACGHDVHTTVGLGVAELLSKHRDAVRGSVKFLFQPAEEGVPASFKDDWGAKLMVAEGAMENPKPDAVLALHCSNSRPTAPGSKEPEQPLRAGQVAYNIGALTANSDRFAISIRGKMAHASTPHLGVDAIAVAAEAITALQMIRSRQTDTRQPLVITVGMIHGGSRENILAEQVEMAGTVRTYDTTFRDKVIDQMHRVLKGIAEANGATYKLEYRKGYPSVINDEALVNSLLPTLRRVCGHNQVIEGRPGMGGEDFSYFSQLAPGFYLRLGVAKADKGFGAGGHTPRFDVDEECLKTGVAAIAAMVCDYLDSH